MRLPVKSWMTLRSNKRLDWLRKPRSPSRIIAVRRSTSVTWYGLLRRGHSERPKSVRKEVACEHPLDHFEGQRRGPHARSRSPHAARPSHPGRARAHRNPHRLRHHLLRRLHYFTERASGEELHDVRGPSERRRAPSPTRHRPTRRARVPSPAAGTTPPRSVSSRGGPAGRRSPRPISTGTTSPRATSCPSC